VEVAALGVQQFPEHAATHHVQDRHLRAIVGAVLHHDAMPLCLLGGLDQLPALVERYGHRNLGGRVFAGAQRRQHHWSVPFPRRRGEHQVEVLLGHHALEVARTAVAVWFRPRPSRRHDGVERRV